MQTPKFKIILKCYLCGSAGGEIKRNSSSFLSSGTRLGRVVNFAPLSLLWKQPPLSLVQETGPQSKSGSYGEEKHLLPVPRVEQRLRVRFGVHGSSNFMSLANEPPPSTSFPPSLWRTSLLFVRKTEIRAGIRTVQEAVFFCVCVEAFVKLNTNLVSVAIRARHWGHLAERYYKLNRISNLPTFQCCVQRRCGMCYREQKLF
jgi:hypothetical protein